MPELQKQFFGRLEEKNPKQNNKKLGVLSLLLY